MVAKLDLFGKPFGEGYPKSLLELAGTSMACILVLCEIRADWPAWNMIAGLGTLTITNFPKWTPTQIVRSCPAIPTRSRKHSKLQSNSHSMCIISFQPGEFANHFLFRATHPRNANPKVVTPRMQKLVFQSLSMPIVFNTKDKFTFDPGSLSDEVLQSSQLHPSRLFGRYPKI